MSDIIECLNYDQMLQKIRHLQKENTHLRGELTVQNEKVLMFNQIRDASNKCIRFNNEMINYLESHNAMVNDDIYAQLKFTYNESLSNYKQWERNLCVITTNISLPKIVVYKCRDATPLKAIVDDDAGHARADGETPRRSSRIRRVFPNDLQMELKRAAKDDSKNKRQMPVESDDKTNPFRCDVPNCNTRFSKPQYLRKHLSDAHHLWISKLSKDYSNCGENAKNVRNDIATNSLSILKPIDVSTFDNCNLNTYEKDSPVTKRVSKVPYIKVKENGETFYRCPIDKCTFRTKYGGYHINRHMLTHTGERPFNCHKCGKTFNRTDILNAHLNNWCRGKSSFSSPHSSTSRASSKSTRGRLFECSHRNCGFKTDLLHVYQSHVNGHYQIKTEEIDLNDLNVSPNRINPLLFESNFTDDSRPIEEDKANDSGDLNMSFEYERASHSGDSRSLRSQSQSIDSEGMMQLDDCSIDNGKTYRCSEMNCRFSTVRMERLNEHLRNEHLIDAKNTHECPKCKKLFRNISVLKEHMTMKNHQPDDDVIESELRNVKQHMYRCDVSKCGRTFESIQSLNRHRSQCHKSMSFENGQSMVTDKHTDDMEIIEKSVTDESDCLYRNPYEKNKVHSFTCYQPNCGKVFAHFQTLNRHRLKVHQLPFIYIRNLKSDSNDSFKSIVCPHCNDEFNHIEDLKRHISDAHFFVSEISDETQSESQFDDNDSDSEMILPIVELKESDYFY